MGIKYEIRYKDSSNENGYTNMGTNSFFEFIKGMIKYRGKIYYYTIRPDMKGD